MSHQKATARHKVRERMLVLWCIIQLVEDGPAIAPLSLKKITLRSGLSKPKTSNHVRELAKTGWINWYPRGEQGTKRPESKVEVNWNTMIAGFSVRSHYHAFGDDWGSALTPKPVSKGKAGNSPQIT